MAGYCVVGNGVPGNASSGSASPGNASLQLIHHIHHALQLFYGVVAMRGEADGTLAQRAHHVRPLQRVVRLDGCSGAGPMVAEACPAPPGEKDATPVPVAQRQTDSLSGPSIRRMAS